MVIGWGCVTGLKYEQFLTVRRQGFSAGAPVKDVDPSATSPQGEYITQQHPVTGEVIRVWVPAREIVTPDDETTPEYDPVYGDKIKIPCQARAIITGGINVQGTAERWTSKGEYENVDFIKVHIPSNYTITKRDQITNISDSRGNVVWLEEEYGRFTPTVFDVTGVSPSVDPFGSLVEWVVMARRADIQTSSGEEQRPGEA